MSPAPSASRAERRRRARTAPRGPLPHTGRADRLAGARWARRDPDTLVFFTMPWPVWLSALGLIAMAAWTILSARADGNWFGAAGLIFVAMAIWLIGKAPRERITLTRAPGQLRVEEGTPFLRTRAQLPFAEIDGFAIEHNRAAHLYRVVAVSADRRLPIGRSFLDAAEARQRITALAEWMPADAPPVDTRLDVEEDEE